MKKGSGAKDRGVIALMCKKWIVENFGAARFNKVMSRVPETTRQAFVKPLPYAWYPVEIFKQLYKAIEEELVQDNSDVIVEIGRYMARQGVKGFLNYLVRLVSVETIIRRAQKIWGRYHDTGYVEISIENKSGDLNQGVFTVRDYDSGPLWCKTLRGYIEVLIQSTGAGQVSVRKNKCIHKGDDCCSWQIAYKE